MDQRQPHLLLQRRVARRLLKGELTLAALGPIDGLEPLDRIAARLAA